MIKWGGYFTSYDYDCVYGVRIALRSNEFLGGDSYYKFIFGDSLHWFRFSVLALRRFFYR